MGSFELGFVTYPEALLEMPGANFWAVLFFFTFMLLGVSSGFAMLDAVMTMIMDTAVIGKRVPRPVVCTILVVVCALISLPYCTEFGYYYLDGVDRWINNVALVFVVWSECVFSTTIYRYRDVLTQVGKPAFFTYNAAYFSSQFFGIMIAHLVSPGAGAGLGLGIFFIGLAISLVLSKTPSATGAPKFWNKNVHLSKTYYLAFYSVRSNSCLLDSAP